MKTNYDIVIVGAGPAGIFTALEIAKIKPELSVLIIDRGRNIEKRVCPARKTGKCINCNPCGITFGWSGAGAFSDGKLSLSPEVGGRILDYYSQKESQDLINYCDDVYLNFGANKIVYGLNNEKIDEIKYEASKHNIRLVECPVRHLGTELAYEVLKKMYLYLIEETNTEFQELTEAVNIIAEDNEIKGIDIKNKSGEFRIQTKNLVVAPGRGGAEWITKEAKRLSIKTTNNEVDIGVRVEVPNSIMDHLTKDLYEAKLVYYSDTFDNKVRTFCMNPGGVVSEEHYDQGMAVVNGHSYGEKELRTNNTNFAMLVSTTFTEPFNQPIDYGQYIAKLGNMLTGGGIMVQRLGDLLMGRRTNESRLKKSTTIPTMKSAVPGDLSFVLPQRYLTSIVEALKAFDKIAPGLYSKNTLLYGIEVKFYSSKIETNEKFETEIKNLYTIGDGAGITRGLMQASVTGVIVARNIVKSS
ncbi:NAD(FAD)-utilizing dehydrogenase [Clostridium pasteurianum DSM 525 = ATCC 6013]|uniref:NAD(FAD)-utilizing dehydrogenase n=1 Tax=Clostridium pasteurianum DSM 525 = ATCC 6013 TaxID=1262449 RepID=A0A0H3J930_CLOPA|nr:FAD-dependent oxidoreductase [Clostridium pasteurianum]AJA50014.1 NAD(FAD)-utilizing dehydrogenase [Clostridium pasteurianum DSM 525 = ATCC 6013]AJA54002.1 NAD(FAD)-utilizing dehydrogenase [Clostridium pasteurianum DSM 525 = ATCC 6013]AOZ77145.1 FAD-dependent oxidoreductase [Clostridium pasteurianum DSM 525 = ATCC 6013]AOZ80942.1 FAD-dependent oxidoreductase [Clostridium pasteurianum]ELP59276.1 NAD(FAD)-utilizing dehydrogenase [Clostridium pasteurianum DSM 525 = ATCC 6013]